jgi:hypothetical protein
VGMLAVNLGEDADATDAVYGQLAGAPHAYALPQRAFLSEDSAKPRISGLRSPVFAANLTASLCRFRNDPGLAESLAMRLSHDCSR